MPFLPIDPDGKPDDRVTLEIGDDEIRIVQTYEISQRFLTQPAAFAARIGDGRTIRELRERYPPNTPYRLFIGDVPQQTGETDGYSVDDAGGASVMTLRGRDSLAPLHDSVATVDKSFGDITYKDLVNKCLREAGVEGYSLVFSNEANRRVQGGLSRSTQTSAAKRPEGVRLGVSVVTSPGVDPNSALVQDARRQALAESARIGQSITIVLDGRTSVADQLKAARAAAGATVRTTASTAKRLQIKLGENWYAWLKKELDRAGLFLFSGVDERVFILTEPNAKQKPTYRLMRQRGLDRNAVNVLSHRHRNETRGRHAKYTVYGRGGSGKGGRAKVRGEFADEEIQAFGITKEWAAEDKDAKSTAQAEFYARRKCAEARRAGWELIYVVEGHTAPSLFGNGRAIWAVDTVVDVQDDELGIYGPHWIEGVTFRRSDRGTTTEIALMRPEDLVFGEGEFLAPRTPKARGGRRRRRIVLGGGT